MPLYKVIGTSTVEHTYFIQAESAEEAHEEACEGSTRPSLTGEPDEQIGEAVEVTHEEIVAAIVIEA